MARIVDYQGAPVDPEASVWIADCRDWVGIDHFGRSRIVDALTFREAYPAVPLKKRPGRDGNLTHYHPQFAEYYRRS